MKAMQPLYKLVLLSIIGLTMMSPVYDAHAVTDPVAVPRQNTFAAHRETVTDMSVKVLGGYLRHNRTWNNGTWYFNRRWEPLRIELKDSTLTADSNIIIHRAATKYEYKSNGIYAHETLRNETIVKSASGYRWQNRHGDWVEYDLNRRATQYGDRNNITNSFQYDAQNRLTGTFDHNNKQIYWYEYNLSGQLSLVKDYSGRKVEYKYTADQLTEFIDVLGNSSSYTYIDNRLATKTDAEGRIITINYTSTGLVKSINNGGYTVDIATGFNKTKNIFYYSAVYSSGKAIQRWYNRGGDFIRETINNIPTMNIEYSNNDLIRIKIGQDGNRTTRTYDEWENLLSTTYPDNSITTTEYENVFSQPIKQVNENGVITLNEYDARGNLTKLTKAAGLSEQRISTYTYDVYGNRLSRTIAADSVSVAVTTSATYDAYGNKLTRTNGEGHVTSYTYDVLGKILTHKNPLNKIWTYTYNAKGKQLSSTNPLNHTTTAEYDKVGNLTKVTDALNHITQYEYDARNNRTAEINALNQKTTYKYNSEGKLIQVTDAANKSYSIAYNIDDRPIEIKDGNGNLIQYEYIKGEVNGSGQIGKIIYPTYYKTTSYDKRGRVSTIKRHLDAGTILTTTVGYDSVGNKTFVTDAKGRLMQYVYDAHSRLIESIDSADGVTKFTYDNRSNLISVTNANGGVYQYTYNKNKQKSKENKPLGEETQYFYNAAGQRISIIDANNHKRVSIYDAAGRRTGIDSYTLASDAAPAKSASFVFNEVNKLSSYSDGLTSGVYQYDNLNRLTNTSINFGSFSKAFSYTYDVSGNKASFTGADGITISYTHDNNNQLSAIKIPDIGQINLNNYQWLLPQTITLPGGATQNYTYDPSMRITGIDLKDPGGNSVLNYGYGYDDVSNIISKQTEHGAYQYGYNKQDGLTSVDNPTQADEAYTYDPLGNRLTDNQVNGVWLYNLNNELTTIGTETTYSYDDHGNLTSVNKPGQSHELIYNADNRLVEVKENTISIASYNYDVFGKRIAKQVNGQTMYYLYSKEGLIAEIDNTGTITKQYGWKPKGKWGTNPVYLKVNNDIYFYQNDHLGTPQKLISRSGAIVWSSLYKSFGNATIQTQTVTNNLRFPGQYYDQETELYYNYYRDYDPVLGRYIESDPIGLAGGLNTFGYVRNNPLRWLDPFGLDAYDDNPNVESIRLSDPLGDDWRGDPFIGNDGEDFMAADICITCTNGDTTYIETPGEGYFDDSATDFFNQWRKENQNSEDYCP